MSLSLPVRFSIVPLKLYPWLFEINVFGLLLLMVDDPYSANLLAGAAGLPVLLSDTAVAVPPSLCAASYSLTKEIKKRNQ